MEENHNTSSWNSRKSSSQNIPAPSSFEPNRFPTRKENTVASDAEVQVNENDEKNNEVEEETGRERLKRHREEVAGRVAIPDKWGKEQMMKDWIDFTTFDALFAPHRLIVTARDALIADARKARSQRLRIHTGF